MDSLEVAIARYELTPHEMYRHMMETCDKDEKEISELKAENERLNISLKNSYCGHTGSDSIVGLDACDDYKDWLSSLNE